MAAQRFGACGQPDVDCNVQTLGNEIEQLGGELPLVAIQLVAVRCRHGDEMDLRGRKQVCVIGDL